MLIRQHRKPGGGLGNWKTVCRSTRGTQIDQPDGVQTSAIHASWYSRAITACEKLRKIGTSGICRQSATFTGEGCEPTVAFSLIFWIRPAPIFFAPTTVGTNFLAFIQTEPGETYSVQYLNALGSGWQSLITVAGNGSIITVTNAALGATRGFYRLMEH